MYCSAEALRDEIRLAQATGIVSDRLVKTVAQIAHGVWIKYHRWREESDFRQEAVVLFLLRYHLCDTSRPPSEIFNWLTTLVANYGRQTDRAISHDRAKLRRYAEWLGDDIPYT